MDQGVQYHHFRTRVKWQLPVPATAVVLFPIGGIVVVPDMVTDVDAYIRTRQQSLAPRRIQRLLRRSPKFFGSVAAMAAIDPEWAEELGGGIYLQVPDPGLSHTRPSETCAACEAAALCEPEVTPAIYAQYRQKLTHASTLYSGELNERTLGDFEDFVNDLVDIPR